MIFLYIIALKKAFAENKEIQKLAEQFVLINLVVSFLFSLISDISPGSLFHTDESAFPIPLNHVEGELGLFQTLVSETERRRALYFINNLPFGLMFLFSHG